jgi:hypothetical protein
VRPPRWLEAERRSDVLLGRLTPDYKSIVEFGRVHRGAATAAGAELVRMARQVGLVKGEGVAIEGSKFRAVSSAQAVRKHRGRETLLGSVGKRRPAGGSHQRSMPSTASSWRSQRSTQPAADGRGGRNTPWAPRNTQRSGRRELLERRASATVRGSGHRAACAEQSVINNKSDGTRFDRRLFVRL